MGGYQRKELQIIGGGLNLIGTPDKTPKTDYLIAQNWRTDRNGKLISRWGYGRKFSIAGMAYAHSGANFGGVESDFYIVANAPSGANPGKIYYDPDHTSTPIVTGLSGNRVGMVPMNGWMWFMDPSVTGRHNPTAGYHSWGIAAPTAAATAAAGTANPTGPNGTYNIYYTWETADESYETNPSPVSGPVTVTNADINISGLTSSSDALMTGGNINIYATGGTLGDAYLIGTVAMGTTTFTWSTNDLTVTNNGVTMPTDHDLPPSGATGVVGPYFNRLYAWKGNRLFYTKVGQPQYWPGSADPAIGNWVDVGMDGETIVWVTIHPLVLVIYKERSVWYLSGDPEGNGVLQQMEDGVGLTNPFAVCQAGAFDYFVAPGSLRRANPNLGRSEDVSGELRPIFSAKLVNTGHLSPIGDILPGSDFATDSLNCYSIALGYAMGKLYVSYDEHVASGAASVLLVYNEEHKRWFYHRSGLGLLRFYGFLFDGFMMQGLTGSATPSTALSYNLDDFRLWYTQDESGANIECIYQSHFEDAGLPDNQKMWLEVVVDYVSNADAGSCYVNYNNFIPPNPTAWAATLVGTLPNSGGFRKQQSFALGTDGTLAKNISVSLYWSATDQVEIHNLYLYYYAEARLALAASTLPTDLGIPRVKQVKELILDIDSSGGSVEANVYSDLPGNALAVRQTPTVPLNSGRALLKFPFSVTEGYLYRVALKANANAFRLYHAWLLTRPMGTYIEAYEAAAGFVWDSLEHSFESALTHIPRSYAVALAAQPIKRFREISLEIDTFNGNVTVAFLTDLPGNAQAVRQTFTANTGTAGRRYLRLPMPAGTNPEVEGRLCRLQLSGSSKFVLYDAAVEFLAIGVYLEAYEISGGAVYDSREQDFGSAKVKEAREIELDIETTGAITATLYSDLPGYTMAQRFQNTAVSTTGRQKIRLPLTQAAAPYDYPVGRLFQLLLTGTHAVRLYEAKLKIREIGTYLTGDEAAAVPLGVFDTTPLDFGTERWKDFKKIELEIQTEGTATVTVWTDQDGGVIGPPVYTTTVATGNARFMVKIPLPPAIRGRVFQLIVQGAGVRLFGGRVWWKPANEAQAMWSWFSLPIPPTPPEWTFAPFPVNPTPPGTQASDPAQWVWGRFTSVDATPDKFEPIEVDFEVAA